MGSRLSSALVQAGLLELKALQKVLARQAILGGELDTILLERKLVPESAITSLLSQITGFPALVPWLFENLAQPKEPVVDQETAEKLGICPLKREAGSLVILVSEAADDVSLEEMAFELNQRLSPFVAPELRMHQARQLIYGVDLPKRFAPLLERLGESPPEPVLPEEMTQTPRAVPKKTQRSTIEPRETRPMDKAGIAARPEEGPGRKRLDSDPQIVLMEAGLPPDIPPIPDDADEGDNGIDDFPELDFSPEPASVPAPVPAPEPEPATELEPTPEPEPATELEPTPEPAPTPPPEGASDPKQTLEYGDSPAKEEDRKDVPLALDQAIVAMHSAKHRDELLLALGRGAYHYLDWIQIYVFKHNEMQGFLRISDGKVNIEGVKQDKLSLQMPSSFNKALESGQLHLGLLSRVDSNELLSAAGISPVDELAIVPIQIRNRSICLLVGHRKTKPLHDQLVGPLTRLAGAASSALSSLIIRRKRSTSVVSLMSISSEMAEVITTLDQGGPQAQALMSKVPTMGTGMLEALISQFPGRLTVSYITDAAPPPPVSECGLLLKAILQFGKPAVKAITPLLLHSEKEVRFFATYLLSELVFPESMSLLANRLRDSESQIRWIAGLSLRRYRHLDNFAAAPAELREDLASPDPDVFQMAAEALAILRDTVAVPMLLERIIDPDQKAAWAAHEALVSLTKQDFGLVEEKWLEWWMNNEGRDRGEWLIEGLVHMDETIRRSAIMDLADLTGMTFGYKADLPPEELQAIHDKFIKWWHQKVS